MSPVVLESPSVHSQLPSSSQEYTFTASNNASLSTTQSQSSSTAANSSSPNNNGPARSPCVNCGTLQTPLWRRDADGNPICNACGESGISLSDQNTEGSLAPNCRTPVLRWHRLNGGSPGPRASYQRSLTSAIAARLHALCGPLSAWTGASCDAYLPFATTRLLCIISPYPRVSY